MILQFPERTEVQLDPASPPGKGVWLHLECTGDSARHDALVAEVLRPITVELGERRLDTLVLLRDAQQGHHRLQVIFHRSIERALRPFCDAAANLEGAGWVQAELSSREDFPAILPGHLQSDGWAEVFARVFSDSAMMIADQTMRIHGGASRSSVALDIMVAQLHAGDIRHCFSDHYDFLDTAPDFPLSFPIYRAHSDGFVLMTRDPDRCLADFDRRYRAMHESLRARILAVISQMNGGRHVSDAAAEWFRISRTMLIGTEPLLRDSRLRIGWEAGRIGDDYDLGPSQYHRLLDANPEFISFLKSDSGYLALRAGMIALYATLSALGLRAIERIFLCYAIARCYEETFRVSAEQVLRQAIGSVSRRRVPPMAAFEDASRPTAEADR